MTAKSMLVCPHLLPLCYATAKICLKCIFFRKNGSKIAAAPKLHPQAPFGLCQLSTPPPDPAFLLPLTDIDLLKYVTSLKLFYYFEK